MEVDEIETEPSKFSRINDNGKIDSTKVGNRSPKNSSNNHRHHAYPYPDVSDNSGREQLCSALVATGTAATTGPALTNDNASLLAVGGAGSRFRSWQHSLRIIRVSRASGGKDRHSKVWTAKGPRDRRVRLSVTTAIQFYDLQDRLGFDQPSKAVEWLIKAAADSIAELPALNGTFPETPGQLNDSNRAGNGNGDGGTTDPCHHGLEGDSSFDASGEVAQDQTQNQLGSNPSRSSACSSTSETSKGSGGGLSLSQMEIRVKARERARVRTTKKDKETDSTTTSGGFHYQQNVNRRQPTSHQRSSSFTQLLTSGIGLVSDDQNNNASGIVAGSSPQAAREQQQQWWWSPMDYFGSMGLMRANQNHSHPTSGSGFIQPSHSSELHHQHFPYGVLDHHLVVPAVPATAGLLCGDSSSSSGHYNLNFPISFSNPPEFSNRGTLQSNSSQSESHYLPRFSSASSSTLDVSTQLPFFLGPTVESHQHHPFPAAFQLCYGDNVDRHSEHEGKRKN